MKVSLNSLLAATLCAGGALSASADTVVKASSGGVPVEGEVSSIVVTSTRSVRLELLDGSVKDLPLKSLRIKLISDPSSLPGVVADPAGVDPAARGVYNMAGQWLGYDVEGLPAGVYVVNGEKTVVK